MPHVLVIGRDSTVAQAFRSAFQGTEIEVVSTASPRGALRLLEQLPPDILVWQAPLPGRRIPRAFYRVRAQAQHVPTFWASGGHDPEQARTAMRAGVLGCLSPPWDRSQLRDLVAKALKARQLMRVPVHLVGSSAIPRSDGDVLVGDCPALRQVQREILRAAVRQTPVLIRGEHGTGKSMVARSIYHYGPRSSRMLLAVDCASVDEPWLEAELFGRASKICRPDQPAPVGKFQQAAGGTLLLREIGALPLRLQTKLADLLGTRRNAWLAGAEEGRIPGPDEVVVMATSSGDLDRMAAQGLFAADLLDRFRPATIRLPPLRERGDDIRLLTLYFLARFRCEFGGSVDALGQEAVRVLRRYPWPGNVRELQSAVRQSLLQATGSVLLPEFLPLSVRSCVGRTGRFAAGREAAIVPRTAVTARRAPGLRSRPPRH